MARKPQNSAQLQKRLAAVTKRITKELDDFPGISRIEGLVGQLEAQVQYMSEKIANRADLAKRNAKRDEEQRKAQEAAEREAMLDAMDEDERAEFLMKEKAAKPKAAPKKKAQPKQEQLAKQGGEGTDESGANGSTEDTGE